MATILIIDDDIDGATTLAARLRREGHTAGFVASAPAALQQLRQNAPDLVLLDLSMPEVDGLQLLRAMGEDPRFEDVRVAILSGTTDPAARTAALRLGACDFIDKKLGWSEIAARVRDNLGRASTPSV